MEKMELTTPFWANKKVLLTGHTGFKGSWLSLWLSELGAKVIGYSLPMESEQPLFARLGLGDHVHSVFGDIRNSDRLRSVVEQEKPEVVFHLAAQSLVPYSYSHPRETFDVNVMGTVNLLDCIRFCESVRSVVVVTTDKCYENREQAAGYKEGDRLGGHDPYSGSKACAEVVVDSYRQSFFGGDDSAGIATARAGNVIGGGDWASERLVPDIVRAITEKKDLIIRRPNAVRPWQHVLEPLSGYLLLGELLCNSPRKYAQAWNFGPESGAFRSVEWVINRFLGEWGCPGYRWVPEFSNVIHETNYLALDCNKAKEQLGWRAKWDIEATVSKTVEWYQADLGGVSIRDVCLSQVQQYRGLT